MCFGIFQKLLPFDCLCFLCLCFRVSVNCVLLVIFILTLFSSDAPNILNISQYKSNITLNIDPLRPVALAYNLNANVFCALFLF